MKRRAEFRNGNVSAYLAPAAVVLSIIILLLPVIMVPIPPLLDYPNHVARFWLISGGVKDPILAKMYSIEWLRAATNIGGDIIFTLSFPLIGVDYADRLLIALSIILPPLGGVFLHRSQFPGAHWWHTAFAFAGWGMVSLVGFLNFQIGIGLALAFAALDPAIQKRRYVSMLVRSAFALLVLAFHPFAAMFYAALVCAIAIGPDWQGVSSISSVRVTFSRALLATAPALLPIVLMLAILPSPVKFLPGYSVFEWESPSISNVVSVLTTGFRSYSPIGDAFVIASIAAILLYAAFQRRLSIHFGILVVAVSITIVSIFMPTRIGEAYWTDRRLPVMAFIAFLCCVRPNVFSSKLSVAILCALLLSVTALRTSAVMLAWTGAQSDIASISRSLSHVQPGCSIISVANYPARLQISHAPVGRYFGSIATFWNYPALAVPLRHAFVPNLFSQAGQQPLRVLPPYDGISTPFGPPPPISALYERASSRMEYALHWRQFDYLLLINSDMTDSSNIKLPIRELKLVSNDGFSTLYHIEGNESSLESKMNERRNCGWHDASSVAPR